MRLIGDDGKQIGVVSLQNALKIAAESFLDLVEIQPNSDPPVARLMDYGKFCYEQKKKERGLKGPSTETKSLQIKIGTGEHDLALKARRASEFLKEGNRVKIELFLIGRTKYLDKKFLEERLNRLLNLVTETYKIASGPQRSPKGLMVILEKIK